MSDPVVAIGNVAPEASLSVIDDALGGKRIDSLEVRLSDELKDDFRHRCRGMGRSMGERMRELIALDTYGVEHVRSLVEQHAAVIGLSAPACAPASVRTGIQADGNDASDTRTGSHG